MARKLTVKLWEILAEQDADVLEYLNSINDSSSSAIKSIVDEINTINEEVENRVEKETGKGLSSNDYTTPEKEKLSGIEDRANNYIHPDTHNADMIVFADGDTFQEKLDKGIFKGQDGIIGKDGISPTIKVHTSTDAEYTLDISDANGTITTPNLKGGSSNGGSSSTWTDVTEKPFNSVDTNTFSTTGGVLEVKDGVYATPDQIPNVDDKLESANIKDGTNITVTTNGNDVTINASGESDVDLTKVTTDIVPTTNSTLNIGSPTNRFKGIYVDEAHLSTNTLYIGDTPLIGTNGATINVAADSDQIIDIKTKGTGSTKVSSVKQVDVIASGVNGIVNVQSANQINIQSPTINIQGTTNVIQGDTTFTGNVNIQGTTTSVNATNLEVKDNIIELNEGEVGSGISKGSAGIKIDRGDLDAQFLVFDEVDDRFKVGTATTKQSLAYTTEIPTVTNDLTNTLKANYDTAYIHSQSTHAPIDATKVSSSTTNGNVKINEVETVVYTHPTGTNPHNTTKADIGLGNVDNTSDSNKPISTLTQEALDLKLDKSDVINITTQTTTGKALDAIQNNPDIVDTIANKIKVLKAIKI